jgi:hypothetical protein
MDFYEQQQKLDGSRRRHSLGRLSKYEIILLVIFIVSLPLSNPWVRGDGVGYYAFGRSLLIEHRLDFQKDWLAANTSFRMGRTDPSGNVLAEQYTSTGHLDNHFSIGPAILWSPFLLVAHITVRAYDALGGHVAADGYSEPYLLGMALGTAVYGFLSLWISFRLARKYLAECWAFWGTLGIWFVVTCTFGVRCGSFRMVLGSHAPRPHDTAVDGLRCDGRADDGRLLPQRAFASVAAA